MTLVIEGARLIDPSTGRDEPGDVRVADGRIVEIGEALDARPEDEIIPAHGRVLAPALIDLDARSGGGEFLQTTAEAAAAGGIGTLVLGPDQDGGLTSPEAIARIAAAGLLSPVRLEAAGALLTAGGGAAEMGLMAREGALFFGDGGRPVADARLLRRLLSYAGGLDAWVALSPEDASLSAGTIAHESDMAVRMGLPVRPALSERIGVERNAALAELTGAKLIFTPLTTEAGLNALAAARRRGLEIAAAAPVTHLMFNEIDTGGFDARYRLDSPLRAQSDREALIEAVRSGAVETVTSAHRPVRAETKADPFPDAAPGSANLEALLPALCTLAAEGHMSLVEALRPVTSGPADLLGLPQGRIAVGAPADLVMVDPDAPVVYGRSGLISRAPSAFSGRRLSGRVLLTLVQGAIVHRTET